MKPSSPLLLVLPLLLATAPSPAKAESVLANGLTNTSLGHADLTAYTPYLTQYGWSSDHTYMDSIRLGALGLDGVAVSLGRAKGGAWFYPYASAAPGRFMSALSFGRLNGKNGSYLAGIAGRRGDSEGEFKAWVDFPPISLDPYRFRFYQGGALVRETVTRRREIEFTYAYSTPRVNPSARLPDGGIAAIIDFEYPASLVVEGSEIYADKIEISPTRQPGAVDYVSSVQIRGGGGLPNFTMYQVRPLAFGNPHRILGGASAHFKVEPNQITLRRDTTDTNIGMGTWVQHAAASQFRLEFPTLTNAGPDATVQVEALGNGIYGLGTYAGFARLELSSNGGRFTAQLSLCPTQQAVILRSGAEVATTPLGTNIVTLDFQNAVGVRSVAALAHTSETRPGLSLLLDRLGTFVTPTGLVDGDEIRVRSDTFASFATVDMIGLTVSNVAAVVITNETGMPVVTPDLHIENLPNDIRLTWLDPNRKYTVQCSVDEAHGPWREVNMRPMLMNGMATLTLPRMESENRFYRLFLGQFWDVRPGGPGRD